VRVATGQQSPPIKCQETSCKTQPPGPPSEAHPVDETLASGNEFGSSNWPPPPQQFLALAASAGTVLASASIFRVDPSPVETNLTASAISPTNVWTVGDGSAVISGGKTVAEHFNGSTWSVVPTPKPGGAGALHRAFQRDHPERRADVRPGSADRGGTRVSDRAWTVGGTYPQHWNGQTWQPLAAPNSVSLSAATALPANDLWAVGVNGSTFNAAVEHWTGASWSVVATPVSAGCNSTGLLGISGVATGHVFAVGDCAGVAPDPGLILQTGQR